MNFNHVGLNLLRVFAVLMREKSVTKAALNLNRTQSAVSHALGRLRQLFNDELFHRDGTEMIATAKARELFAALSPALSAIRNVVDSSVQFVPAQSHRNFRLGMSDYHAVGFLPALVKAFAHAAPHATLNVMPMTTWDVGQAINARQLDCVIIGSDVPGDANLLKTELGCEHLVCAIWSGSDLMPAPLSLKAYLNARHLQVSIDGKTAGFADRRLAEHGLQRQVLATIPTYQAIPWVLRDTNLITHCAESIALTLPEKSEVTLFTPPLAMPAVAMSLFIHRHLQTDPAIVWFHSLVKDIAARWVAMTQALWGTRNVVSR